MRINSFAPSFFEEELGVSSSIEQPNSNTFQLLVLGSIPGVESLNQHQYYAHPRNSFWWIMSRFFEFPLDGSYTERLDALHKNGVILWDVLGECERSGSLDSAIKKGTEVVNDIPSLLNRHPTIKTIAFNGKKSQTTFTKHINTNLIDHSVSLVGLPSTSPAYAAMKAEQKYIAWREILRICVP